MLIELSMNLFITLGPGILLIWIIVARQYFSSPVRKYREILLSL